MKSTQLPVADTIRQRDFVIVGLQPWDVSIGSNCKNIAMEIARHNRVLYVNSPLDRFTACRERKLPATQKRLDVLKGKEPDLIQVEENIWNLYPRTLLESINWLKTATGFDWLNQLNNKRFATQIASAIHRLGFKDIILFNDNDIFRSFYLKELLEPAVSVYYSRDYLLGVNYWKTHGLRLEPELIAKSDVAVANSTYLADYLLQYNRQSYCVGQGCDLSLFDEALIKGVPTDLQAIRKPIIGYVGALLGLRLDFGILVHIARTRPDWNLVLVGPEDEAFRNSPLHQMDNVHFLGHKDIAELPSYIHAFDVCLNPQIVNEVTIGNYPRKIDEYLALGKPVVATRTQAMEIFADYVQLADTKEDYIPLIEKELAGKNLQRAESRRQFAASHTWENNVKEIYRAINRYQPSAFPSPSQALVLS